MVSGWWLEQRKKWLVDRGWWLVEEKKDRRRENPRKPIKAWFFKVIAGIWIGYETNPQISQMDADLQKEQRHGMIGQLLNFGCLLLEFKPFVFSNLRPSAQSAD